MSFWNVAVEHGKAVKEIDENLASLADDKQIAELLLRRTDAINRRGQLIKAVENAIKVKYQPEIPEMFSAVNRATQSRLVTRTDNPRSTTTGHRWTTGDHGCRKIGLSVTISTVGHRCFTGGFRWNFFSRK